MLQRKSLFKHLVSRANGWAIVPLVVLFICLLINPVAACNPNNSSGRNSGLSEIVILDNDRGKTFTTQVGDIITIRLAENPTTGYRWDVGAVDKLIEFQGADYQTTPRPSLGSGGTRIFHFKAKAIGTAQIQLKLRRSWEPEDKAIEQFTVNIRIQ